MNNNIIAPATVTPNFTSSVRAIYLDFEVLNIFVDTFIQLSYNLFQYLYLQERRSAVDEAGKAADEFYSLFYKTLEQRPHVSGALFFSINFRVAVSLNY